ncbi:hypothetical protein [Lysinibacter sp. HNR]|uniref:hypothetical protein n=1 Tax=Lysinibacter sp. HNR TaxID=3031408 RepID=UPI0024355631|nr:hypothetical protein [Lysinibacter sp. HNR]WGD36795.1 hypothetical protein FrondiHNR_10065 [Lysinibacter sp. HNR]
MKTPIRFLLTGGIFLCLATLLTSAIITQWQSSSILLQGEQNTLRIAAIGSPQPSWTPTSEAWSRHTGRSYTIELVESSVAPGQPLDVRMAVRNESPITATHLTLSLYPVPVPGEDPADSDYLFSQLAITVRQGQTLIVQNRLAPEFENIALPNGLAADEYTIFDVQISLIPQTDQDWMDKKTGLEFQFVGTSA